MMPALPQLAAVLLVAFGGLMAAIDAALGVTLPRRPAGARRSARGRGKALRAIADGCRRARQRRHLHPRRSPRRPPRCSSPSRFARCSTASGGAMLLLPPLIMTAASFVLVGSSPRTSGASARQQSSCVSALRRCIRGVRVLLGPLAHGLVALGNRVTPGAAATAASFASEEQLLEHGRRGDGTRPPRRGRPRAHPLDLRLHRHGRARGHGPAHRHGRRWTPTPPRARRWALFLEKGVSRMPVDRRRRRRRGRHPVPAGPRAVRLTRRAADGEDAPVSRSRGRRCSCPESMKAETLLQQMQRDAIHVCLVVDEYGGIAGPRHAGGPHRGARRRDRRRIRPRADEVDELGAGRYRVSARLPVDEVGDLFGIELDDEDVDSVGGLLGKALGRVPQPGAAAEYSRPRPDRRSAPRAAAGASNRVRRARTSRCIDAQAAFEADKNRRRERRMSATTSSRRLPGRIRDVRRTAERRQVDAHERAGGREGRHHEQQAADDAARDPRHPEPRSRAAHHRRHARAAQAAHPARRASQRRRAVARRRRRDRLLRARRTRRSARATGASTSSWTATRGRRRSRS